MGMGNIADMGIGGIIAGGVSLAVIVLVFLIVMAIIVIIVVLRKKLKINIRSSDDQVLFM